MSSVKIENSTLSLYIDDIEKKNRGPIKDTKCRSRLRKRKKKRKETSRTVHNNIRYDRSIVTQIC